MKKEQKKEKIWNAANIFTFSRIIIAFLIIYFIFADFHIIYIALAFIIGMLTDFFDGQIARIFNLETEFGRQFDMIADRILMLGVAFSFIIKFGIMEILTKIQLLQIFLILSREIIIFPFFILMTIIFRKGIPKVRFIGRITTCMQGITFPLIILSIFYRVFEFSLYFAIVTSVVGLVSGFYYIYDVKNL